MRSSTSYFDLPIDNQVNRHISFAMRDGKIVYALLDLVWKTDMPAGIAKVHTRVMQLC